MTATQSVLHRYFPYFKWTVFAIEMNVLEFEEQIPFAGEEAAAALPGD